MDDDNKICINKCKAMCCRGPLVLQLTVVEHKFLKNIGKQLQLPVVSSATIDGDYILKFLDHPGFHCAMLDSETSMCRIYEDRPKVCREFPLKVTPGCLISEKLK